MIQRMSAAEAEAEIVRLDARLAELWARVEATPATWDNQSERDELEDEISRLERAHQRARDAKQYWERKGYR